MEKATESPIKITENALKELEQIKLGENIGEDQYLRIGVKGGGCSGFSYILGFDTKKENDVIYEIGGMGVIIDEAQALYLFDLEVDYHNGLENRGFVFNNPNANETCGCGSSFSV